MFCFYFTGFQDRLLQQQQPNFAHHLNHAPSTPTLYPLAKTNSVTSLSVGVQYDLRDVASTETLDRIYAHGGNGSSRGPGGGHINPRGHRNHRHHHHRFASTTVEYFPSNGLRSSAAAAASSTSERRTLHYSAPDFPAVQRAKNSTIVRKTSVPNYDLPIAPAVAGSHHHPAQGHCPTKIHTKF